MTALTNPSSDESPVKTGFTSLGADNVPPGIDELQALLPHLEILALIGHGGMGTFYQARQSKIDRLVAVKILPVDPGDDAVLIEGFIAISAREQLFAVAGSRVKAKLWSGAGSLQSKGPTGMSSSPFNFPSPSTRNTT